MRAVVVIVAECERVGFVPGGDTRALGGLGIGEADRRMILNCGLLSTTGCGGCSPEDVVLFAHTMEVCLRVFQMLSIAQTMSVDSFPCYMTMTSFSPIQCSLSYV